MYCLVNCLLLAEPPLVALAWWKEGADIEKAALNVQILNLADLG